MSKSKYKVLDSEEGLIKTWTEDVPFEEHEEDTKGVECRKDADMLDESPKAYKDIDKVMEAQSDLIDIKYTLKQILCIKG